jgi:hypothetical protein
VAAAMAAVAAAVTGANRAGREESSRVQEFKGMSS